jgi:hypothetical protein
MNTMDEAWSGMERTIGNVLDQMFRVERVDEARSVPTAKATASPAPAIKHAGTPPAAHQKKETATRGVFTETEAEIEARAAALARIACPTPKPLSAEQWLERLSKEPTEEEGKRAWQSSPALRQEFGTLGVLLAYARANRNGVIKDPAASERGVPDEILRVGVPTVARAREMWEGSDALRAEFATPEVLWHYCKNARAGGVRLLK